jgi:hypothetical protein
MTYNFCLKHSLNFPKEETVCIKCGHYYSTKPVRQLCEFCIYATLPLPNRSCSGCGKKYPVIIEEKTPVKEENNIFWKCE